MTFRVVAGLYLTLPITSHHQTELPDALLRGINSPGLLLGSRNQLAALWKFSFFFNSGLESQLELSPVVQLCDCGEGI